MMTLDRFEDLAGLYGPDVTFGLRPNAARVRPSWLHIRRRRAQRWRKPGL